MKWLESEINIILNNYNKIEPRELLKLLPEKTLSQISKKARKLGLKFDFNNFHKKYSHDEDYFNIPNINNCFLTGMIATDGCLLKSKSLSYGVSIKDDNIIDFIIKELNYTGHKEIIKRKYSEKSFSSNNISRVRIASFHKNFDNLNKFFNIIPNKTLILNGPNLDNNYLRLAFFIGAIDGDGTISMKHRKKSGFCSLPYISICSASPEFIKWIKETIDSIFEYKYNKNSTNLQIDRVLARPKHHKPSYKFTVTGLRASIIIDYLSQFPVNKLQRKWFKDEVWQHIDKDKEKFSHLFKKLDMTEIEKLLPKETQNSISQ